MAASLSFHYMNMELGRRPEIQKETTEISWPELSRPLTVGFADESGAVLADKEKKMVWYLDLGNMSYRKFTPEEFSEERLKFIKQYNEHEGRVFENGAVAAVSLRKTHLEEQIKMLNAQKKSVKYPQDVQMIIDGLNEELTLLDTYLKQPEDRTAITKKLNEMYEDMRSEETETETQAEAA